MAEPKSSVPGKALPTARLATIRRVLTLGGIAVAVVNVGLMIAGTAGTSGPMLAAVLWGAAAVCFLGAFVAYMMEPVAKLEGKGWRPHHSLDAGIRELIKGYQMLHNEIYSNV